MMGPLRWTRWDDATRTHVTDEQAQPEEIPLLELPGKLAAQGYAAADVCHFHVPDTSPEYLERLRAAFREAGVRLYTLLLDYGDISSADEVRRGADLAWMKRWIDVAAAVGAERVRIIGGDAPPDDAEALGRAAAGLNELCDYAAPRGVRVVTENFKSLTSTAANCLHLLDACGGRLGLITDFGNFGGPGKLEELARTVPRSEEIHAKAMTDEAGRPNADELQACLDVVKRASFAGPITIVYDGPGDMWEGIGRVRAIAEPYLGEA